jgi:O-antigen/teichoic acid export membrane protein
MNDSNPRLFKNIGALGSGLGLNIATQILLVPIFLHFLSIPDYSQWLVASNLAQIYILADLGTLTALQNRIVFYLRRGIRDSLQNDIQTVSCILWIGFSILFSIVVIFISLTKFNLLFSIFLIFTISSFLSSHYSIYEGMARGYSETHLGLYRSGLLRLVEFIGYILAMFFGSSSIFEIAITGLAFKLITWIALVYTGKRSYKISTFPSKRRTNFRQLMGEGTPFLVLRMADLLNNGLLIVVLSNYVSPRSLILFSILKTFFRIGLQLITVINYAFSYEMTESWALSNYRAMNMAIKNSGKVAFAVAGIAILAYLFIGSFLFELWTNKRFITIEIVFYIGAIYSFTSSISQTQKVKFNATNTNMKVAIISIFFAGLNLLILANIPNNMYPNYPFMILIITDVLSLIVVYLSNRRKIEAEFSNKSL